MTELTPAQLDVAALVAKGLSNKQIAHRLRLQEATVKSHIGQAIKRLGLYNRVQLAVWHVRRELAARAGSPSASNAVENVICRC